MTEPTHRVSVPIRVSRGSVIASIQSDVTADVVASLQQEGLAMIGATAAHGFVIDLSGVEILEPEDFQLLVRVTEMAKLMGAQPVLCGLRAGVVSALVDLDTDLEAVDATRTIDDALDVLAEHESHHESRTQPQASIRPADPDDEAYDPDLD